MEFNKMLTDTIKTQNDVIAAKDAKIKVLSDEINDLYSENMRLRLNKWEHKKEQDGNYLVPFLICVWAIIATSILIYERLI